MAVPDDLVTFADEAHPSTDLGVPAQRVVAPSWTVLIVDDDEDVHQVTRFSLDGVDFLGRPLAFLSAYSAAHALDVLRSTPDVAVILLDVVMEDDHAGLDVVGKIRDSLGLHKPRIILRTGQPGYAPEMTAVRDYDINDYKTKSELTRTKLFTTLMAAIRAYDQICRIEAGRQGLERIVQSSGQLLQEQGLRGFAAGVVTQLAALMGMRSEGLVCAMHDSGDADEPEHLAIIGAAGRFERYIQADIASVEEARVREGLLQCLREQRNVYHDDHLVIYFPSSAGSPFAAFVDGSVPPSQIDERLLQVFCSNVALCAKNIHLVQQLRTQAFSDPLVRLPNRTAFVEQIEQCLTSGDLAGRVMAVVDIDAFGEINNAFGHVHADQLLRAIAQRLAGALQQHGTVARLGGDAFGILGPESMLTPASLKAVFAAPFQVGGHVQTVHAGCGFVRLADVSGDAPTALKDGFIALKLAKRNGLDGHAWFSADLGAEALERTRLLNDLEQAFTSSRLFAVYQPQVDLSTGHVLGFEALMRWRDDSGHFIRPDRFIPLAESSGLIVALGNWMLRSALQTLRGLPGGACGDMRMAVNVSVVQFRDPAFLDNVAAALRETGVAASCLELEITESVAMVGADLVRDTLHKLRDLGVAIAIDDFGTGYSSLSYLESLPVDRLKIDRSFVKSLGQGGGGGRIAHLVVDLGRQLGLRVLAEGVELESQAQTLRQLGCHEAQGYLFGQPMNAEELSEWMKTHARSPAPS